jgi:alpha-L-arabinofuranosidase
MKKRIKLLLLVISVTGLMMITAACRNEAGENATTSDDIDVVGDPVVTNEITTTVTETPLPVGDYDYSLIINGTDRYDISDMLYGLFFEDINFAVDGGLYSEKIKNRSFEYGYMAQNEAKNGWYLHGDAKFEIMYGSTDGSGLNENNTRYARVSNQSGSTAGIANEGFLDGLAVEENAVYNFSAYFRAMNGYNGKITIRLQDTKGTIYGETTIDSITDEWWKYEASLTATASINSGLKLFVLIENGTVDMDMVSLFPKDTYKGRKNGLRKDLAEALEDLTPKFIRFPGGCVVEGESLQNAYNWKDSIGNGLAFKVNGEVTYGDVATRVLGENLWGNQNSEAKNPYYMSYGLGFYEYFLLCEDLGAAPVPILNAGLSCLIQGTSRTGTARNALEIGTPEFNQYIQDALDLVEFCKGDTNTTWGAIRIAMGHVEPFDLTYVGIGNEQWGEAYFSRYEAFKSAFEQAALDNPSVYGDIELIVANGPVASDRYAWNKINVYGSEYAGLVDEHYYMTPSWFLTNTKRYDSYDRASTPVFLGEYAAKSNNMEAALAEAAYMTGIERNGDIVKLASYAPLFGNGIASQWSPDLLWFQNNILWKSVNYYVQQLFSNNKSSKVLDAALTGESLTTNTISGKIGVGTWMTAATFDNIKVVNNESGEVLYTDDFTTDTLSNLEVIEGSWSIEEGQLKQSRTSSPINNITGDAAFLGDSTWTNYTLTLTATKLSGNEGFLIPVAVKDEDNYFHWNIGGWGNTVSCLEQISAGSKSGQISETVTNCAVETGKAYELKIVVSGNTIECYLDGKGMIKYSIPQVESVYQVTGIDDNKDMIVKIVNVSDTTQSILIQTKDLPLDTTATVSQLMAEALSDMNRASEPDNVTIKISNLAVSNAFIYVAPKYSVTIIRIPSVQ